MEGIMDAIDGVLVQVDDPELRAALRRDLAGLFREEVEEKLEPLLIILETTAVLASNTLGTRKKTW